VNGANPIIVPSYVGGPAILTNAAALPLLCTSNHFARAIDRSRFLAGHLATLSPAARKELNVSERRVRLIARKDGFETRLWALRRGGFGQLQQGYARRLGHRFARPDGRPAADRILPLYSGGGASGERRDQGPDPARLRRPPGTRRDQSSGIQAVTGTSDSPLPATIFGRKSPASRIVARRQRRSTLRT
jgi:hypothetical protein